ncbi:WD repeat and HMG-box DNA-binding protein 1 isoform 2-T2 [Pholidichthys leucotaenia]
MCERTRQRYGHSEGHTEVCYDHTGRFIVTCGADGDVRIYDGLDDDDPQSISVGEKVYSLALKNGKLVTASSNNTVQSHTFPDGDPDGILIRFTTSATHVAFNSSGSRVAAGSSDFVVKVVDVSDSNQQKTLRGHEAPVLSVAYDPKDEFVASASCDGSVVVWNIDEQTRVVSWPLLQKTSDVTNAKSLCRLAWQPGRTAKFLAVPVETKVHLYERGSWDHSSTLADDQVKQLINVVVWSPCGRFLAAGCVGGLVMIWDVSSKLCVKSQKQEKGFTVCCLAWHPSGTEIVYTDTQGSINLLDGLGTSTSSSTSSITTKVLEQESAQDYDDLFDEDDDGLIEEGLGDTKSPVKKPTMAVEDDDDDDFLMPATGRVRNRGTFLDDDNSLDTGSLKLGQDRFGDDDDTGSAVVPAAAPLPPLRPVYEGPLPTPPQKAFQPGSTPTHLSHRFMMWNSVGIVRGYNDEQDNAIDVEFHDSAVHHAMHLTNSLGHTMAALSQEAMLLACPSTDELASKLQCIHFSSWDTVKEWMVDLPKGEDVKALCLGEGWVAVATSALMVRLFSIGGLQKEIFSLAGPVVCMAAHGDQLLIVYHRATGFDGDQALGVQLLQLGRVKRQLINGEALPLSPRSYLCWLGFSAEGTPCYVASDGVVRIMNRSLGNTWTPVCNTRETCKSPSDHYWVVGLYEGLQHLRCIPCKGSRYPPTLPRPAVVLLPFRLPLCQTTTEKGQMEEQFWRSVLFHNHYSFLSSANYEVDEEAQARSQKEQQEVLMKMFALSCKLEREFRCVELSEMMTRDVVNLAIRYASRSRRMGLAQRLTEVALEKANQDRGAEEQEEEEEMRWSSGTACRHPPNIQHQQLKEEMEGGEDVQQEEEEEGEEAMETTKRVNPFAKEAGSSVKQSVMPTGPVGRSNPFKVSNSGIPSASSSQGRVTNILDNMTSSKKVTPLGGSAGKMSKNTILRPLAPRPKTKTQSTLLQMSSTKSSNKKTQESTELAADEPKRPDVPSPTPPADDAENKRPKTGFQLWLDENRKTITADHPNLEETGIIKEAMGRFRTLSAEERLSWTERAKGQTGSTAEQKKRKRPEGGEDTENDVVEAENGAKRKSFDPSSKLSAFAFNKN